MHTFGPEENLERKVEDIEISEDRTMNPNIKVIHLGSEQEMNIRNVSESDGKDD